MDKAKVQRVCQIPLILVMLAGGTCASASYRCFNSSDSEAVGFWQLYNDQIENKTLKEGNGSIPTCLPVRSLKLEPCEVCREKGHIRVTCCDLPDDAALRFEVLGKPFPLTEIVCDPSILNNTLRPGLIAVIVIIFIAAIVPSVYCGLKKCLRAQETQGVPRRPEKSAGRIPVLTLQTGMKMEGIQKKESSSWKRALEKILTQS